MAVSIALQNYLQIAQNPEDSDNQKRLQAYLSLRQAVEEVSIKNREYLDNLQGKKSVKSRRV
jgi:hypothetical protein